VLPHVELIYVGKHVCPEWYMDESKKQKLTLSVDAGVVEKAKLLGLNISEITESVLRGFTFEPNEVEQEERLQKYAELFKVITKLLKKYGTSVNVGESEITDTDGVPVGRETVYLMSNGNFWLPDMEAEVKDIHKFELYEFHEPNKILSNLIEAMAKAAEENKQSLKELELARRIVEAIGDTLSKSNNNPRTMTTKDIGLKLKTPASEKERAEKK